MTFTHVVHGAESHYAWQQRIPRVLPGMDGINRQTESGGHSGHRELCGAGTRSSGIAEEVESRGRSLR